MILKFSTLARLLVILAVCDPPRTGGSDDAGDRPRFARAFGSIKVGQTQCEVTAIVGTPDDIRPPGEPGTRDGEEVWCFGTDKHLSFPTLGRVCFLKGRVRLVIGGSGKPPSRDMLNENELRRLLRIVNTIPDLWGETYSPTRTINNYGFISTGPLPSPMEKLEFVRSHCKIRQKPLTPTDDLWSVAVMVILMNNWDNRRGMDLVYDQLTGLLDTPYSSSRSRGMRRFDSASSRWSDTLESLKGRRIHWDKQAGRYVVADK